MINRTVKICTDCGYSFRPTLSDSDYLEIMNDEASLAYYKEVKELYGSHAHVELKSVSERLCENCRLLPQQEITDSFVRLFGDNKVKRIKAKRLMPPIQNEK